jgi:TPR repeat protein
MQPLNEMKSCQASPIRSAPVLLALLLTTAVASADEIYLAEGDRAYRAKDYENAASFYHSACAKQWGLGCYKLAMMHSKGEGVKIDKERAKYFFRRGCDLEVPEACASMKGDVLVELNPKLVPQRKGPCDGRRVCEKTADGQYIYRTETGSPLRWYFLDGRLAPRSVWPK